MWLYACVTADPSPGVDLEPAKGPPTELPVGSPGGPAALATEVWTLHGRSRAGRVDHPPLPPGAPSPCALDGAALCLVEVWHSPSHTLTVERREASFALSRDGAPPRTRPRTWNTLGTTLGTCLGDPLALPPAADPGGHRGTDGVDWVLAFSGNNPCRLGGTLRLALDADRVDVDHLRVDGLAWHHGGRSAAEARLRETLTVADPPTGR